MNAVEVLAVVAAVLVAMLVGALVAATLQLRRTQRELRSTLGRYAAERDQLVDELRGAVRHARAEVDRVDRLVRSAETIEERVDTATNLAYRTLSSPVVKAMAFGAGVKGASRRLRGDPPAAGPRRRREVS